MDLDARAGPRVDGRSLVVAGEGTARVLRGPEAHDLNHRLRAKYIKPGALDGFDRAWGPLDDG